MTENDRRREAARHADRGAPQAPETGEATRIPVAQEVVEVGKRVRETGRVVVQVTPSVEREVIDVPLMQDEVIIERVPVNRPVNETSPPRQDGDTMIVPVYEEVLVVEKQLVLREEIRIRRQQSHRNERREVERRTEEAQVLRKRSDAK